MRLQKKDDINTVCLSGGSLFLPEVFAKTTVCDDIELPFGSILYFLASQVARCFCVALTSVMTESLSLIRYNGGGKEFLLLLQETSTMFRFGKFSSLLSSCSNSRKLNMRIQEEHSPSSHRCLKVFIALPITKKLFKTSY